MIQSPTGARIQVLKNKLWERFLVPHADQARSCIGRTGELRWEYSGLQQLWGCTADVGTAGKEGQEQGVRNVQGKSRCAWKQEWDWCVVQARDKGLVRNPRLLPGEVKFFLNRTRSLRLYLKVVLIRHQYFQRKVFYAINFFELPLLCRSVPTASFFQEKPEKKEDRIQNKLLPRGVGIS